MNLTEEIFNSMTGKAGGGFIDVDTYLEIGVREGNTFSTRVPLVNKKSVAIDCWDLYETPSQNDMGRARDLAKTQHTNLKNKFKDNQNVEIVRGFSNDSNIISKFDDGYFDLIFIDGDHSYDGVKEDLNNWWPKCNTLFCGHDYMLKEIVWGGVRCGVKDAVDEFVTQHNDEIKMFRVYTKSNNPTWFIWKK